MNDNFHDTRETVRRFVQALAGIQTVWEDEPLPQVAPAAKAIVSLLPTALRVIGRDEKRQRVDHNQDPFEVTYWIVGYRLWSVQVKCQSYDVENGPDQYLSRIRDSILFLRTRAHLLEQGIGFSSVGDTSYSTQYTDDRAVAIGAFNLVLSLVAARLDPMHHASIADFDAAFTGTSWASAPHVSFIAQQGRLEP